MAILTALTSLVLLIACCLFSQAHAANSTGCGNAAPSGIHGGGTGQSNSLTLNSSGIQREYLLHLPTSYSATKAHSLIFSFHGHSKDMNYQEKLSMMSDPYFNTHSIVVYPNGINGMWQGFPGAKTDDVQFTLDLIHQVSSNFCINTDKIYAAGKSNGGGRENATGT
jgi:poly(3-hydroxybutyrate) depolymerase